jgi:hypothetical protein
MDTMFGDLPRTRAVDPVPQSSRRLARPAREQRKGLRRGRLFGRAKGNRAAGHRQVAAIVARIPADDRMIKMVDGNPVGVILLERKVAAAAT